jgi:hypothetical protein
MMVRRALPRVAPVRPSSAISRSTVHRATVISSPVERQPHLACSVDTVISRVDARDLRLEFRVADLPRAGLTIYLVVVARWGDRHTQLGQLCADRLDTPPQTTG